MILLKICLLHILYIILHHKIVGNYVYRKLKANILRLITQGAIQMELF